MKKSKYTRMIIAWLLVILWEIVIFCFSNATGDQSRASSSMAVKLLNMILHIDLTNAHNLDLFTFIVRKAAHMSEYFILMGLVFHACYQTFSKKYISSALIVFLLACLDEFHQLFVAERSGQFRDVLIDMSGALICLGMIYLIHRYLNPQKKDIISFKDVV